MPFLIAVSSTVKRVLPLIRMMHSVAYTLIDWYHSNKRDLPWRNTRDPYLIWLSEIILQQTRVEQGRPYYERFKEAFPSVASLAKAKEEKVLKLWQGLGYYSRARNLHKAARMVLEKHQGIFPTDHAAIRELPGIGDYTAAAIASFAYDLRYPVVDGNVYRFLSRLFGIDTPIDSTAGKKEFLQVATELIQHAPPHEFNQAIMEFGALTCVPTNPNCDSCVFRSSCIARKKNTIQELPVKAKKQTSRNRYFHYIVLHDGKDVYLKQRTEKDIGMNLWEFPMLEEKKALGPEGMLRKTSLLFKNHSTTMHDKPSKARHLLSHQTLHAVFYEFTLQKKIKLPATWKKVNRKNLQKFPVPKLIEKYIRQLLVGD